jgi:hypothetical protein
MDELKIWYRTGTSRRRVCEKDEWVFPTGRDVLLASPRVLLTNKIEVILEAIDSGSTKSNLVNGTFVSGHVELKVFISRLDQVQALCLQGTFRSEVISELPGQRPYRPSPQRWTLRKKKKKQACRETHLQIPVPDGVSKSPRQRPCRPSSAYSGPAEGPREQNAPASLRTTLYVGILEPIATA